MINWQAFHFIRPEWLFAIIPLLILVIFLSRLSSKRSGWQGIVSNHLYQHLVLAKDKKSRKPPFYLIALTWLVACIAMAGPTWQKLPQPVYQVSTGKVVVLDMSMSMRATDLQPDRLSRAKFKTIDLLNSLDDGEVGLVVYAGDAFTVSPLTADVTNITTLIPSLRPEIMPIPGSLPILALEEAERLLSSAGYAKGEIYWISDGIELDDIEELQNHISNSVYRYSVLGVGTENGAPIKMLDGSFMKDASGNIILPGLVSRYFDQALANSNARYTPIQNDDSDIKNMQFTPLVMEDQQVSDDIIGQGDQWQDMGAFLVLLILPFAAYAFRRGVLVILLSSFLFFPADKVSADEQMLTNQQSAASKKSVANEWYNKAFKNSDQQGLEAFNEEDFDAASNIFDDLMWKGAALYKNKNYEAALDAFGQIPGAESHYNQGNALAKLGKLEEAIKKYDAALAVKPDHMNAAANKKLVEELLQQQNEQEQQQQDQQKQNQDSDQQNSDNQQSGDSEQSEQQSEQANQNNEQSGEPQQSQQQEPNQQNEQQNEQDESQSSDQQSKEDAEKEEPQTEQKEAQENAEASEQKSTMQQQKPLEEMTPEEKEQMQRMQMLMNKVPDDPAYLLQRKMLLESQQRRNERFSKPNKKDW